MTSRWTDHHNGLVISEKVTPETLFFAKFRFKNNFNLWTLFWP